MGQPFNGVGLDGFDNMLGKYVESWVDNASTMMMTFIGACSDGGKKLESMTDYIDPASGEMTRMKSKTTVVDDNHYVFEAWNRGPDGEFHKSMQIDYHRKS